MKRLGVHIIVVFYSDVLIQNAVCLKGRKKTNSFGRISSSQAIGDEKKPFFSLNVEKNDDIVSRRVTTHTVERKIHQT